MRKLRKLQNIFAKYRKFRSKTSSRKYGEKEAKSIAFSGFSTVFALPVVRVHLPLRRVVRILRNIAKYCESLSFSQDFCKVLQSISLGFQLRKTYFHSFSHIFAVFAAHATELVHLLSRPCFFSSCAKVIQCLWKASGTSDLS